MLSICVEHLTEKLNLKPEVKVFAEAIVLDYLPKTEILTVKPKNKRNRIMEGNMKLELDRPGLTDFEKIREITSFLVDDRRSVEKEKVDSISKSPVELGVILVVVYIAVLYAYCDTRGLLVEDVILWITTGDLPYLTAYKKLQIPKLFFSLYKPLNIPSVAWIRKKLCQGKLDVLQTFRVYFPFIFNLCLMMGQRLSLPSEIPELAYKLYLFTNIGYISIINSNAMPETIVAAHIVVVLKLLYGLNDKTYLLDLAKTTKRTLKHQIIIKQENLTENQKFLQKIPKLSDLFLTWEKAAASKNCFSNSFNIRNLDQFLEFSEKNLEAPADSELFIQGPPLEKSCKFQVNEKLVKKSRNLARDYNKYLKTGMMKIPAQDYWMQKKKAYCKRYPFEYFFALHAVCALCGKINTQQVNFIIGRIDRILCKKSFN